MNLAKDALKKLFAAAGYELRKRSQTGLDAINDIRRILGNPPAKTVLDVGAHLGETAIGYVERLPEATVYSVEPFLESFAKLQANTRRYPNVKSFNLALGEADGERQLNVNQFHATNSFLPTVPEVKDAHTKSLLQPLGQVTIRVQTLDSFCREARVEFIDLLKIDVQGFEMQVLRGGEGLLSDRKVALLFSEVTFEPIYVGQATFAGIHAHLAARGFEVVDLYGQTRNSNQGIRWCDVLFVNPEALGART